ncbi:MAG: hypothetical protein JOZ11_19520 [Alphaproteobacteria bacterium]|nr:hypothetical protein [Alphaproteobacteria bacterium]
MRGPGFRSRSYRSVLRCFGWVSHKPCRFCRRGNREQRGECNLASCPLRIGTRGSPMALRQTAIIRDRLIAAHPELAETGAIEIVTIRTTGDQVPE